MAYRGEDLQEAIKDLLDDELAGALDVVEARWVADPLTLRDVQTITKGYKMDTLELPSTSFPLIWIIAARRAPDGPKRTKMQRVQYQVALDVFVTGETEAEVNRVVHRYTEAIIDVLQAKQVIGGFTQVNYEPQVDITVSAQHLKNGTDGDTYTEDDVDYIRMSEITVVFSREAT